MANHRHLPNGRRSFIERQRLIEAERERLRADALQHERDLLSLRFKELDAQQKTMIVMVGELQKQVSNLQSALARSQKAIIKAILEGDTATERSHAEKVVRDFVFRKGVHAPKA